MAPNFFLNTDTKLISKLIATRLKKIFNNLISENQIACINNRFISEGGRLISYIVEITDLLQIDHILLTVDTEKAFGSDNHFFFWYLLLKSIGLKTIF